MFGDRSRGGLLVIRLSSYYSDYYRRNTSLRGRLKFKKSLLEISPEISVIGFRLFLRTSYDLEEGRMVVKQLRALDWMAIDGATHKQSSSFDPSSPNSPGESNQTFMLNHETIRTESANKRAGSPISPPPLKPPSGHLTLLFTRPRWTKS